MYVDARRRRRHLYLHAKELRVFSSCRGVCQLAAVLTGACVPMTDLQQNGLTNGLSIREGTESPVYLTRVSRIVSVRLKDKAGAVNAAF